MRSAGSSRSGQRGGVFSLDAGLLCELHADRFAGRRLRRRFGYAPRRKQTGAAATRFDDGFMEQAVRQRRRHHGQDRPAAGGFAEDRDVMRVAAKRRDVLPYPLQRRDLVEEGVVAQQTVRVFPGQRGVREEAEAPHAIVEADEHDAALGEMRAVVNRRRTAAVDEAAAIDPPITGSLPDVRDRRPHVEVQAILGGFVPSGAASLGKGSCMNRSRSWRRIARPSTPRPAAARASDSRR